MMLDELIDHLEAIKAIHGGQIPIHVLTVQDSFIDAPCEELQLCAAGTGITIVPAWGPFMDEDLNDHPKRLVLKG